MPHHMRKEDNSWFREAVTVRPDSNSNSNSNSNQRSLVQPVSEIESTNLVDAGLGNGLLKINKRLAPGVRVTVRIDAVTGKAPNGSTAKQRLLGSVVSPRDPRQRHGLFWGFQTRLASSLSEVFQLSRSPLFNSDDAGDSKYDCIIGQSSGTGDLLDHSASLGKTLVNGGAAFSLPVGFKHLLVVFGGPRGLEECVDQDEGLSVRVDNIRSLFDHYLDMCPSNGSRIVRSEEAILISLSKLHPYITAAVSK